MVIQRFDAIVRVPDTDIILIERSPILEVPLHNLSMKGSSMQNEVVDIRLGILPDLGRSMRAEGIDKTVCVKQYKGIPSLGRS